MPSCGAARNLLREARAALPARRSSMRAMTAAAACTLGAQPRAASGACICYTGSGAVLALLALDAIGRDAYGAAFAWMAIAMFIDCTDGTLARRVRVKQVLPQFDGSKLDDIVDYLNYVCVPIVLVVRAGLLPGRALGTGGRRAAAAGQRLRLLSGGGQDARPLLHRLSVVLERRRAVPVRPRLADMVERAWC